MTNRFKTGIEDGIYLLIWLVVFMVPVFVFYTDTGVRWVEVKRFWYNISPFLILFLINNYLLLPFLFLRKRYFWYLFSVLFLIALFFTAPPLISGRGFPVHPFEDRAEGRFPDRDMPPGPGYKPFNKSDERLPPPRMPMPIKWGRMLNDCLLAILLIGFNIAIRLIFKSIIDSRRLKELESQNLRAELNYLKAQVNPHFFMNTLNNIHALIDFDTEKAKNVIIELSKLMRYVLYEADKPLIPLSKEIEFLNNYIALMRIRYLDDLEIDTVYPEEIPVISIPPLLLLPLIENAFKHGAGSEESFIHTRLVIADNRLKYVVSNGLQFYIPYEENGGVGLNNLWQRLELLYGEKYVLEYEKKENEFITQLIIPVEL